MGKVLPWLAISVVASILFSASFCAPFFLNDANNKFLENFVNHEFLSLLGVLVTITLASTANLHLEFNKLEEATGRQLPRAREAIKRSAYWLIGLFGVAFLVVLTKPAFPAAGTANAIHNSLAILILFFNILVLFDITRTVFKIPVLRNGGSH